MAFREFELVHGKVPRYSEGPLDFLQYLRYLKLVRRLVVRKYYLIRNARECIG